MSENFTIDLQGEEELIKALEKAPDRFLLGLKTALHNFGTAYVSHIRRTRFGNQTTPNRLKNRSGKLRRFKFRVLNPSSLDRLFLIIFPDPAAKKYAPVHEFGATIKAKPGKKLIIPTQTAEEDRTFYTQAGVAKFQSVREYVDDGTLYPAETANVAGLWRADDAALMFIFKDKVVIPPRLGMRDTLAAMIPQLRAMVLFWTKQALESPV